MSEPHFKQRNGLQNRDLAFLLQLVPQDAISERSRKDVYKFEKIDHIGTRINTLIAVVALSNAFSLHSTEVGIKLQL